MNKLLCQINKEVKRQTNWFFSFTEEEIKILEQN